jgi:FKBP-type peptidyl-prolyl cis-trans isomerase FkpA
MEEVDKEEHKKSVIGVVMFLSIVVVVIAAFYIYDVSADVNSKNKPTPSSTAIPIPSGNLEIDLNNSNGNSQGKEVQPKMAGTVTDLKVEDLVVGTGLEATQGKKVTVNYVGTLTSGQKFDSSYDRNTPFSFNLGAGEVIKGWDMGVVGMKVGGKRRLTIPSSLAYGDQGVPNAIPGGATLIFEVELLGVE